VDSSSATVPRFGVHEVLAIEVHRGNLAASHVIGRLGPESLQASAFLLWPTP